jgi:hypothetical protein
MPAKNAMTTEARTRAVFRFFDMRTADRRGEDMYAALACVI